VPGSAAWYDRRATIVATAPDRFVRARFSMPELPEVETVRRSLVDRLVGRRIVDLRVGDFPAIVGPLGVAATRALLTQRLIVGLERRGKYLLVPLDDGTYLAVHLRMTGQLRLVCHDDSPLRFERLAMVLDDGRELRFCDQRKFGRVVHYSPEEKSSLDRSLGPEPLSAEFTTSVLVERLGGRSGRLKPILLDQAVIAGLGNIYVDEALFRARLHPERPARTLSPPEIAELWTAIRAVLSEALDNRGTTLSDFQDGDGQRGANQHNLSVYGRGRRGEPCLRCGSPLACIVVGGRSSHYCPSCQPLSR
jgi:formamidopyrimidine-DNA glycosylase